MPKKKKNYRLECVIALILICLVEAFTNIYWNDKVNKLNRALATVTSLYYGDADSTAAIVVDKLALQDKYENMRRYAWKLEKKIQKLEKTLEYEAEVKP